VDGKEDGIFFSSSLFLVVEICVVEICSGGTCIYMAKQTTRSDPAHGLGSSNLVGQIMVTFQYKYYHTSGV
jgi:hypothetical protein